MLPRIALTVVLMFVTGVGWAAIYTWKDEHGHTHYGDRPVSDDAREVTVKPLPASRDGESLQDRLQRQRKMLNIMEQERLEKQEQDAKAREDRKRRKQNCSRARDNLDQLQRSAAIYELDEQGKRRYLTNEERTAAENRAKQLVKKWCT